LPPVEREELIGATLAGRYVIERRLGEGGMATVYLAVDRELNRRRVVAKFPDVQGRMDSTSRDRFLLEIRSLSTLEHPHVIKIFDAGQHEDVPYAIVQFAGGGDLKERIKQGPSTPEEVLPWLKVVSEALDFVHRHGYCHRDVKPANIFLDEEGHAYLSDFGIATAMAGADHEATLQFDGDLTTKGAFLGSPLYAPPEAIFRQLSPAYDQYSLAVTVYEVLSGKVPIHRDSGMDLIMVKSHVQPREIKEFVPDLPSACSTALMRALSVKPEDRFANCSDFCDAFAAGVPGAESAAAPRSWRTIGLAGAFAALVALASVWLARQPVPGEPAAAPFTREQEVVIDTLKRVETGSSSAEFEQAIRSCQEHDRRCVPEWFVSETLRSGVIAPYALDLYEVSTQDFEKFVASEGYVTTAEERGFSYHRYVRVPGLDWRTPAPDSAPAHADHPVVHVSWSDAVAFCAAAELELPTEEAWEFAARGEERRNYPWGNDWDDSRATWGHSDFFDGIEAISGHPSGANPLGHEHLSGNVAEWTSTSAEGDRVIKGGSWQNENPAMLRAAARNMESPDYSSSDIGFRCMRALGDDES
jgi:serine/threonine-protein kinase